MLAQALWLALLPAAHAETCAVWGESGAPIEASGSLVSESSGVAASRTRPGVVFTHEDHNGAPRLYAFDLEGRYLGDHDVRGADNDDWEDIAAAPCPDKGDCLYIGDIGDNDETRDEIAVHIVREPAEGEKTSVIRTLRGAYPDGAKDAETLLVHPCTGVVYVVTKTGDGFATVYRFPQDADKDVADLGLVATFALEIGVGPQRKVTGGDFDIDGDRVVLRTLDHMWEWTVDPDAPEAHWDDPPLEIASVPLDDSEAVTYTLDGDLLSTSEGFPMTMASAPCAEPVPGEHACLFPYEPGCGCATPSAPTATWAWMLALAAVYRRRSLDLEPRHEVYR